MKIGIVGAGQVGASTALEVLQKELAGEVVMVDIVEGMPQGKALDMLEANPLKGLDIDLRGSNSYADLEGSDIVVVSAGLARKPGMSRMDLLKANIDIIRPATENIVRYAPRSTIILVTNPLDIMTYVALKVSNFEPSRVCGMAGVLDAARFRAFLAMELGVSVEDVSTLVLGGHGDAMVPLPRLTNVSGVPALELISKEQMDRIVDRTRKAGGEIVALLKTGSAYYAPATAVAEMVEAIVKDRKRFLPVCAYLDGEYGFKDVCAGVPVILGRGGVERIVEIRLTDDEKAQFSRSVGELITSIGELRASKMI